jgi:hypothetical protein
MKTKPDASWFHWSDGRAFTKPEWKKFSFVLKRQKVKGENFRRRFDRVRAVVEKYEATQKRILITEPGVIARAWNFVTGKANNVKLEVGAK